MVIVGRSAPVWLRTFAAHAMHRATLWQIGDIGLQEAVDGLRFTAWRQGLVHRYGRQEIEWIIGSAFAELGVHYGDIRPKEGAYP